MQKAVCQLFGNAHTINEGLYRVLVNVILWILSDFQHQLQLQLQLQLFGL